MQLINENPVIYDTPATNLLEYDWDDSVTDPIIDLEIFELIRNIQVYFISDNRIQNILTL